MARATSVPADQVAEKLEKVRKSTRGTGKSDSTADFLDSASESAQSSDAECSTSDTMKMLTSRRAQNVAGNAAGTGASGKRQRGKEPGDISPILAALAKLDARLDAIEKTVQGNSERLDKMNAHSMVDIGSVGRMCGVTGGKQGELIEDCGNPSATKGSNTSENNGIVSKSKSSDAVRPKKQASGGGIYASFVATYAVLMVASFMDLLPVFEWERMNLEQVQGVSVFLQDNMWVPFALSLVYLLVVFGIQDGWLKNKQPFDLRYALSAWSFLLSVFSIWGSLRCVPALVNLWAEKGFRHMFCGDSRFDWLFDEPAGFWTVVFIFSKVPELVDTLFIVLRKKRLITLHWYHHITVMTFCWHSLATMGLNGLIFAAVNLTVHGLMYFFYGLTALGYRPTQFAIYITLIQVLQMVLGSAVAVYVNYHQVAVSPVQEFSDWKRPHWDAFQPTIDAGPQCKMHPVNAYAAGGMYGSYLYLFASFFFYTYLSPKAKVTAEKKKQ